MSAAQRALAMCVFMICIGFGMTIIEEVNANYETETGRIGGLKPIALTSASNYTDFDGVSANADEMNATINSMGDFQKPQDITQDFSFFQGMNMFRLITNLLINTTQGFPKLLALFGMPTYLINPMAYLIGLTYILLGLYMLLGKSF